MVPSSMYGRAGLYPPNMTVELMAGFCSTIHDGEYHGGVVLRVAVTLYRKRETHVAKSQLRTGTREVTRNSLALPLALLDIPRPAVVVRIPDAGKELAHLHHPFVLTDCSSPISAVVVLVLVSGMVPD